MQQVVIPGLQGQYSDSLGLLAQLTQYWSTQSSNNSRAVVFPGLSNRHPSTGRLTPLECFACIVHANHGPMASVLKVLRVPAQDLLTPEASCQMLPSPTTWCASLFFFHSIDWKRKRRMKQKRKYGGEREWWARQHLGKAHYSPLLLHASFFQSREWEGEEQFIQYLSFQRTSVLFSQ